MYQIVHAYIVVFDDIVGYCILDVEQAKQVSFQHPGSSVRVSN
jgi:hypothetical protein